MLKLLSVIPFFSLSRVKSAIYRALGAEIGEHVKFRPGVFLFVPDFKKLKIGDGVEFGHNVKINCDEIEIGDDARISHGVVATGPSVLKIGRSCYLAPRVYIDLNEPVIIEDDVGIGADYIFTHSVWHPITEGGPRKFGRVHIKQGAWIPAGVFIMPGVTIGEKATVGARSLVIHDVPDGCLAAGIPARVIKTAEENKRELSFEEKDRIVQDIVDEYLQRTRKNLRIFSEKKYADSPFQIVEIESKEKENFLKRKKRWALLYTNDVVKQHQLNRLREFCRKFHLILLISLASVPTDVLENLGDAEFSNLVWFSVESKMRKKSWNKDAVALHNFFRSRYGIRFKFYRDQCRSFYVVNS